MAALKFFLHSLPGVPFGKKKITYKLVIPAHIPIRLFSKVKNGILSKNIPQFSIIIHELRLRTDGNLELPLEKGFALQSGRVHNFPMVMNTHRRMLYFINAEPETSAPVIKI